MDNEQLILDKLQNIESKLDEHHLLQKEVLTFEEACKYLDFSASHLYKLTSTGKIPHYKPQGKRVYFQRTELDQWLMAHPVKTQEQIEQQAATYLTAKR